MDAFDRLEATIHARRGSDPAASYVASLFAKGRPKIAQKLGEEATETVIAALAEPDKLASEAADLIFHLIVLLADAGLTLDDVRAELARRDGVSGHAEKAARPDAADPDATPAGSH
jgi:phosphoribosyl-ATP pyrophosphohydrolase